METQTEQKLNESHSIACGNDDMINANKESQGVDAIVKTNEMAS